MFIKYFENDLAVIPLRPATKIPMIKNWQRYCKALPHSNSIEIWEEKFNQNQMQIGLCCGKASNIIALDIDTDSKEVLDALPVSPVRRVGQKGEVRFFQYDPEIKSIRVSLASNVFVEILSDGRQVALPPSIHPVTDEPYRWVTTDTLENFKTKDLPRLTQEDIKLVCSLSGRFEKKQNIPEKVIGRNDILKQIVTSMFSLGKSVEDISKEIMQLDKDKHKNRLFLDAKEGFKGATEVDALINAKKFTASITKSLTGVVDNSPLSIDIDSMFKAQQKKEEIPQQTTSTVSVVEKEYPRIDGLIGDIASYIETRMIRKANHLALGGAVSLLSVACANRFVCYGIKTNSYVLNVAPTGAGKSGPQDAIMAILRQITNETSRVKRSGPFDLLGAKGYKSGNSILIGLEDRPERLDVIDEAAEFFMRIKGGGVHDHSIQDMLCELYSAASNGEYRDKLSMSNKGREVVIINPCLCILASSTPEQLSNAMTYETITSGLIQRFFIFYSNTYAAYGDTIPRDNPELVKILARHIIKVMHSGGNPNFYTGVIEPLDLTPMPNSDVDKLAFEILKGYAEQIESDIPEILKRYLTRAFEQIIKLAIIHCATTNTEKDKKLRIEDLKFAQNIFETSLHNVKHFLFESFASNDYHKAKEKAINVLRSNSPISYGKLLNKLKTREFKDGRVKKMIVDELIQTGTVHIEKKQNTTNNTTYVILHYTNKNVES